MFSASAPQAIIFSTAIVPDALYSILQMPPGIPVATVAIDGAKNAGLLAVRMLAMEDDLLREKLKRYSEDMCKAVEEKDRKLQESLKEA